MISNRRGLPWTDEEAEQLRALLHVGASLPEMVAALSRSGEGIDRQLAKMGMSRTGRERRRPADFVDAV